MAENKKSFLLYCDLLEVAKELDDKSRGELFLYILKYVNDLNPEPPNELIKMLFIPIKQQLKRDLKKYEKPKIITITNVLAQINNLNEFAKGLRNIINKKSKTVSYRV